MHTESKKKKPTPSLTGTGALHKVNKILNNLIEQNRCFNDTMTPNKHKSLDNTG